MERLQTCSNVVFDVRLANAREVQGADRERPLRSFSPRRHFGRLPRRVDECSSMSAACTSQTQTITQFSFPCKPTSGTASSTLPCWLIVYRGTKATKTSTNRRWHPTDHVCLLSCLLLVLAKSELRLTILNELELWLINCTKT